MTTLTKDHRRKLKVAHKNKELRRAGMKQNHMSRDLVKAYTGMIGGTKKK